MRPKSCRCGEATRSCATVGNGLVSRAVGLIAIGGAVGLVRHYRTYTILNIVAIVFGLAALGSGLFEIARAGF